MLCEIKLDLKVLPSKMVLQVLYSKCTFLIVGPVRGKCEKDNFIHILGHNLNLCKPFYASQESNILAFTLCQLL